MSSLGLFTRDSARVQARSQDFSLGGRGVRIENEDTNFYGGSGACSPGKILETLKCLRLHFARFHGGEKEKDNVEKLCEKINRQRLIF